MCQVLRKLTNINNIDLKLELVYCVYNYFFSIGDKNIF